MRYVLVGFAVLGVLYTIHRIAVWAEGRGWIYYLKKQGSSGALGNAFLEVQAMIEPSAKHVLEERLIEDLEAEEAGDPPDPGRSSADVEADREAIRKTTAELLTAVNASDVDRVLGVWAEDGVLMPPNHPSGQGRAALQQYFRDLFSRGRFTFQFTSSDIEVVADAAFERVSYTGVAWLANGAGPIEDVGKGLHLYRREADGSWKLYCDIWNSDRSQ